MAMSHTKTTWTVTFCVFRREPACAAVYDSRHGPSRRVRGRPAGLGGGVHGGRHHRPSFPPVQPWVAGVRPASRLTRSDTKPASSPGLAATYGGLGGLDVWMVYEPSSSSPTYDVASSTARLAASAGLSARIMRLSRLHLCHAGPRAPPHEASPGHPCATGAEPASCARYGWMRPPRRRYGRHAACSGGPSRVPRVPPDRLRVYLVLVL